MTPGHEHENLERPGPLPPRVEWQRPTEQNPYQAVQDASPWNQPGSTPPAPFGEDQASYRPPVAVPGPASGPPVEAAPGFASPPGSGSAPPAGFPSSGFAPPLYPAPTPAPPRRRTWPGVVALVLALVLLAVAAAEGYLLYDMDRRLDRANRQAATDRTGDGTRLDDLDRRTDELERQLGSQFNPSEVATAAVPSVFRVAAGNVTGTAFAVGRKPTNGGTYLFTNHHVVEDVWASGQRQVFLERRGQRFPATIVKVDAGNDVALLEAKEEFNRLATSGQQVRSGEQIVVIGAPLGLQDSVTTGVVSAFQKVQGFPGEMMQFDAAINPGNSGGPVINSQKQVVGIATAKAEDAEGIGLAVPIDVACKALAVC